MRMYRQGDILIMEDTQPTWGQLIVRPNKIVAYGEVTGHKHEFEGNVALLDHGADMYAAVHETAKLVHDEHATIEIPEGFYRVIRQREFDGEHIRKVAD